MFSKKLLVTICLVILVVVFGALLYQIYSLNAEVTALENKVGQTTQLGLEIQKYEYGNESLNIVALVNDYDFNIKDYFGLAFDTDNDSQILGDERVLVLYPNNMFTSAKLLSDGTIVFDILLAPSESPYHTCTFDSAVGYTFNVSLPLSKVHNLVYMCFHDHEANSTVHIQMTVGVP